MHQIQTAYAHRWTAPAAIVVGLAFAAVGVEGRIRSAIINSEAEAHRAGYRLGKRVRRAQLAAVSSQWQDARAVSK